MMVGSTKDESETMEMQIKGITQTMIDVGSKGIKNRKSAVERQGVRGSGDGFIRKQLCSSHISSNKGNHERNEKHTLWLSSI